jgi:hypothetical protein
MEKENTLIQKKWTNKNKDEEKYTKYIIIKNYMTQEQQDYEQILLTI